MRKVTLIFIVFAAAVSSGCFSPTENTVIEFDNDGRITKKTITSESVVASVINSTKNKTVFAWDNSFLAYFSASTSTTEDPTPTVKMGLGRSDKGVLTLMPGQSLEHAAALVRSAREGHISVSDQGITSSSTTEKK